MGTAPVKLYTGVDIVELDRFRRLLERHREGLRRRVFTPIEWRYCQERVACLALRFAAKEAAAKALGTGIGPIAWKELEVLRLPSGAPQLVLHGRAQARAQALGWQTWTLSLSDTRHYAVAVVVALAHP